MTRRLAPLLLLLAVACDEGPCPPHCYVLHDAQEGVVVEGICHPSFGGFSSTRPKGVIRSFATEVQAVSYIDAAGLRICGGAR